MSWDRLTRTVAPATPSVSLDEAKRHMRIENADNDAWITSTIAAAESFVDGPRGIGIALITQTWRLDLDCWPWEIRVPLGPVSAISSITYTDLGGVTQTLASNQYVYDLGSDPVLIRRAYGAFWPPVLPVPGTIKVTFVAGFGAATDIPLDLKHAVLLLVSHLNQNREAVVGIGGRDSPAMLPYGADAILERYRAGRIS